MSESTGSDLTFPENQEWLLHDYELHLDENGQPLITETFEQREKRERLGVAQLYYVGQEMSYIIKCFPEAEAILEWIKDNNINVWNVIDKRRKDVEGGKPSKYPLIVYQALWNNNTTWDYSDLQYHLNLSNPGAAVLLVETLKNLGLKMRKAQSPSPSETSSDEDPKDAAQYLAELFESDPTAFENSLYELAKSSRDVYAQRLVALAESAPQAFSHHLKRLTTLYKHEVSSHVSVPREMRTPGEEDLARVLMPPPPLPRTPAVMRSLQAQAHAQATVLRGGKTANPNSHITRTWIGDKVELACKAAHLAAANAIWREMAKKDNQ
jgi:hypothetical protein